MEFTLIDREEFLKNKSDFSSFFKSIHEIKYFHICDEQETYTFLYEESKYATINIPYGKVLIVGHFE